MGQITVDAQFYIEHAQCLLALVADPIMLDWLKKINPATESMYRYYGKSKPRNETYSQIVEHALSLLHHGKNVCFVVYGHPGVFTNPTHELMRRAASDGLQAHMLPGVSAEDCLFADLGIDPGDRGCQSFEATDFLLYDRRFDPTSPLLLWQFGAIGERNYPTRRRTRGIKLLADRLAVEYGPNHTVVIYQAALYTVCNPIQMQIPLKSLPSADYTPMCTLYVPPLPSRPVNPAIARALGLAPHTPKRQALNTRSSG